MGTNLDLAVYDIIRENDETYIVCKCVKCGGMVKLRRDHYLHGVGCGICNGKRVLLGYNDLATRRPDLVQYFVDPRDASAVTEYSHKSVDLKCPVCGYEKKLTTAVLSKRGFRCPICYGGFSVPNRCMASVLNYFKYEFKSEACFDWACGYRYDFYVPSKQLIIEMHGKQHYKECSIWIPLEDVKTTDETKKRLAVENGFMFYSIRADRSEVKYIINQIITSGLLEILTDDVDIAELEKSCVEDVTGGVASKCLELWNDGIRNTKEIEAMTGIERATVAKYLGMYGRLGLCDFSRLGQILKSQSIAAQSRKRPVVCVNTGIVYDSIKEASQAVGINKSCIQNNLTGYTKSAGKDAFGNKLVWKYVNKE